MNAVKTNYRFAVKALENYLKTLSYESFVSFEQLNKIAGVDITTPKFRYILEAARRSLISHHDRVLVNVRGQGYQIANLQQTMAASSGYRKRSYNSAKKAFEITKTVDLNTLSDDQKHALLKEQEKSACLLVVYRATENKLLNAGDEKVQINSPSETSVVKMLLDRSTL
jgi:hypothetical protein